MILGLDLDGTIDEAPEFFRTLSQVWPGEVLIVTHRTHAETARRDADRHGIRYHDLLIVESAGAKARVAAERNIDVFVDDADEVITAMPATVTVLKIRHEYNFDFSDGRWWYHLWAGKLL